MAYTDSWWSQSAWWNPLAALSNFGYNVGQAFKNQDASYIVGGAFAPKDAAPSPVSALFGGSNSAEDSSSASLGEGLNNLLTGNVDYQRQQALMEAEQAYNSAEAEKAHQRSVALQENSAALERELRQSQYQDTVAGMRAAGLNPALMYGGGSAQLVSSAPPVGGSGSRASIGPRSAPHAGAAASMIAGALISAGAMLANSALTGKIVSGVAPRKIGF